MTSSSDQKAEIDQAKEFISQVNKAFNILKQYGTSSTFVDEIKNHYKVKPAEAYLSAVFLNALVKEGLVLAGMMALLKKKCTLGHDCRCENCSGN